MVPTHFHLVSTIRAASGELRPLRLNCPIEYIAGTSAGRSVRTLYRSRESDKKHEGIKVPLRYVSQKSISNLLVGEDYDRDA